MFTKNSRFMIALLLLLSLLIVACGEDDEDDGDSGDNGSSSVELSETFSQEIATVGTLSISHPSGWVATFDDVEQTVGLGSSQEFLDAFAATELGEAVEGDGDAFNISVLPSAFIAGQVEEVTAQAVFDALVPGLETQESDADQTAVDVGDASSFDTDNYDDAVRADISSASGDGVLYVVNGGDNIFLIAGILNDGADTVDAMVRTINLTTATGGDEAPAGDDTGDATDGDATDGGDEAPAEGEEGEAEEGEATEEPAEGETTE